MAIPDLDNAALRRAWREAGRKLRQAKRDLERMGPDNPGRGEAINRRDSARQERAEIEDEAKRRGLDLGSSTKNRDFER